MTSSPAEALPEPSPAASRTIVCVGGEGTPWMARFRALAAEKGFQAQSFPVAASLTGAVSRIPYGVVVFDSGEDKTPAKLKRIRECTRTMDVPIVAVVAVPAGAAGAAAAEPGPGAGAGAEHRGEHRPPSLLLAAGAHAQFSAEVQPAEVLKALSLRADLQPVLSEIQINVLNPFIETTRMTLREMAGVEVQVKATYQKQSFKLFGDISAVLGLFGASDGAMVLSFPRNAALAVARQLFPGMAVDDDEELVHDCVAELANIIAGQTKGRLAGTPQAFNISTPTMVVGMEHTIQHKAGLPSLVAVFQGRVGEFALQVCMSL